MTKEELQREANEMGYTLVFAQTPKYKPCPKCGYVNKCKRGWSDDFTEAYRMCPRCGFTVRMKAKGSKDYNVFNKIKIEWNLTGSE